MALKNKWIGYVDRTYQQIKEAVLTKFGVDLPEMTDHTESNPYVKFLSIWAGMVEHLNYYLDNIAREVFLSTARQYQSAVKIASMFDYRVRGAKGASVDLTFYLDSVNINDILIPTGTQVKTSDGIIFTTTRQDIIYSGELSVIIPAVQMIMFSDQSVGMSSGLKSQKFPLTQDTEDTSVAVTVAGTAYLYKETLAFSGRTDAVFTTSINTEGYLEIVFGNGTQGIIPPTASSIIVNYGVTVGAGGNLAENTINTVVTQINPALKVTNYNRSSGGSDIQSLADLQKTIPLSIRTLRRAVTEQDYEDIANMVSGVYGSKVIYSCGKTVDVYVVPEGGGIAAQGLLDDVWSAFYDNTKMVTTRVRALAAGEVKIMMEIDVYVLPAFSKLAVESAVRETLTRYINFTNGVIGGSTELGNLYEILEAVTGVDYTKIKKISIVPFARITSGEHVLNWTRTLMPASSEVVVWNMRYSSAGDFELLRNGTYFGTYQVGNTISFTEIQFTLEEGEYIAGDAWQFITYPFNDSIKLAEPSVLALTNANLTLNMFGGV